MSLTSLFVALGLGIDCVISEKVLLFEFGSSPCLCSLKNADYLLYENRRGPLGENTTYILRIIQTPHIHIAT